MGPKRDTSSDIEASYEDLEREVDDLAADIKGIHAIGLNFKTDPSKRNVFQARLSRLDSTFEKFQTRLLTLKKLSKQLAKGFQTYQTLKETTYELYYETLDWGMEYDQNTKESLNVSFSDKVKNENFFKLPTLSIPTFDGNISNWPSFKDTFTSLIHSNSNIKDIEKFHYLKSSLKGAASQAIAAIAITSVGYEQAWEALLKRYDNKRILATNHLIKILNFKPLTKINLPALEQFSAVVLESANALLKLNLPDPAGFVLCTLGLRLLDTKTRERFEAEQRDQSEIPGFKEFSEFIHQQCVQLQTSSITSSASTSENKSPSHSKHVLMSMGISSYGGKCSICSNNHRILECSQFRSLSPRQRYEKIKSLNLCLNCCAAGHNARSCPSKLSCRRCNCRHHTLLHFPESSDKVKPPNSKSNRKPVDPKIPAPNQPDAHSAERGTDKSLNGHNSSVPVTKGTIVSATQSEATDILLGTAMAQAKDKFGNFQPVRILIDCGSQRSFITTECTRRLCLAPYPNKQRLVGLGKQPILGSDSIVTCTLKPNRVVSPQISTTAIVIDNICSDLPTCHVPHDFGKHLTQVELADPAFHESRPIDFLLGADLFGEIFNGASLKLPRGWPHAMDTIFGWVLLGKISSLQADQVTSLLITEKDQTDMHNLMSKFWEVEELSTVPQVDPLHVKCEEHFERSHYRDEQGRYVVELPFRDEPLALEKSKFGAIHRFQRLEQKFVRDPQLKEDYDKVIREHLEKGYAEPASLPGHCFLPHHGVTKDSTTTKLRVVFDASYSTSEGSLNDQLMVGPKLQNDIRDVLLRFRLPRFVMTTDISQMYLRITVAPVHRSFQHFFYRFKPTDAVTEYELKSLPFGLACSPYLAMRVLSQLIRDEGEPYPYAVQSLKANIYIDDILVGADTLEEALTLQRELIALLGKGGFQLKKWSSNAKELLPNVPAGSLVSAVPLSNMEDSIVKILGMKWEPGADILSYAVQLKPCTVTKRGIMSCIARMYDPLGYLGSVVFRAKTILQELWLLKLNWDDDVPKEICRKWEEFFTELPNLRLSTFKGVYFQ